MHQGQWKLGRGLSVLAAAAAFAGAGLMAHAEAEEIRIGVLAPLTGALASPGQEMINGKQLFWDEIGHEAGGRNVRLIVADTACNPDQAITQARRLVDQENVHLLIGPLCGHEGPAVAQVGRETGVPILLDPAGADEITKWTRVPNVVRTAVSASQIGHPFGDYMYNELGLRRVTLIGQDYTWGHEVTLGAVQTFKDFGGEVEQLIWTPIGTTDYGPVIAGIPDGTDAVLVTVVGADRIRFFDAWFDFGMDQRHRLYGLYWLHEDALPQVDDRAIGLISNSVNYVAGIETPENEAFVAEYARRHNQMPSWFAESGYTSSLWAKTAIDAIDGNIEDSEAFLAAVRAAEITAPRGPLRLDEYDNPIQNVYISEVQKRDHPVLGEILVNVPIKTYEAVSQFWTWDPEEFLARGPYQR
jgi:branched-chain amino acid transport system substrate-binding protein